MINRLRSAAQQAKRAAPTNREYPMARRCDLTGKRQNVANKVSHSNVKTKKVQFPNLQVRRIWWAEESRFVTLKLSTRVLRTLRNRTLGQFRREQGLSLS